MHTRRVAAATYAGDTIQSGEGSDSKSSSTKGESSDGGSDDRGDTIITDMVGYLLGDN